MCRHRAVRGAGAGAKGWKRGGGWGAGGGGAVARRAAQLKLDAKACNKGK